MDSLLFSALYAKCPYVVHTVGVEQAGGPVVGVNQVVCYMYLIPKMVRAKINAHEKRKCSPVHCLARLIPEHSGLVLDSRGFEI